MEDCKDDINVEETELKTPIDTNDNHLSEKPTMKAVENTETLYLTCDEEDDAIGIAENQDDNHTDIEKKVSKEEIEMKDTIVTPPSGEMDKALQKEMKKWAKFNKQLENFREEQLKEEVEESAIKEEVLDEYDDVPLNGDVFDNVKRALPSLEKVFGCDEMGAAVKSEVHEDVGKFVKQELTYETDDDKQDPDFSHGQVKSKAMKKPKKIGMKNGKLKAKLGRKPKLEYPDIPLDKVNCETCNKKFKSNQIYRQHWKRVHDRVPVNCDVCGKACPDSTKMYEHKLRIHTAEVEKEQGYPVERFTCAECPEGQSPVYTVQRDFTKHKLVKHSGRPKPPQPTENCHFCDLCGKGYKKKWPLVLHMRRHNGDKPFTCDRCAKTFFLKGDLKRHYEINHTGKDDRYICNTCGKTYDNVHNFKVHERTHQKKDNKCDECGLILPDKGSYREHVYYHGDPQFHCKLCSADIRTPELMKKHLNLEHGLSPFSCEICCQECLSRDEKKMHFIHFHHDKSFQCKICFKEFMKEKHLTNHMKTHAQIKRFRCSECPKAYVTNVALNAHITTVHKGEKNFMCDICNKSFGRYNNLLSHKVTHSGVKPFQCVYCNSGYAEKRNLMNHISRNHPGQPLDFKREFVKTE